MLLTACAPANTAPAALPATIPPVQSAATESSDAAGAPPVAGASAVASPAVADQPFVQYGDGTLWVQLFSPQDGAVVQSAQINIEGQAPAGTVISLNDTIYIVPADQSIHLPIVLEEGPNVLELVASDVYGNEVTFILTLTFEP